MEFDRRLFPHCTVGSFAHASKRSDGTSNLILQGLGACHIQRFPAGRPFPIATIESLESDSATSVGNRSTGREGAGTLFEPQRGRAAQLPPKVDRYLSDLSDPELLADLVASTFVSDPLRRQRVLEERSINKTVAAGDSVSSGRKRNRGCVKAEYRSNGTRIGPPIPSLS
jgi:hypothetical protein